MIVILLILIILLIVFHPRRRVKKRIRQWMEALQIEEHHSVFKTLYQNVDGFALSKNARMNQDAPEYLYGETEFVSLIALLSLCPITPLTRFYDLGSGTGKAVLACAMVFDVQECKGIEIFPALYHAAESQVQSLQRLPQYELKAQRIQFEQGDFLHFPLPEATLILIQATAFFGDHWIKISQHLEQIQENAYVISISKPLHSEQFIIEHATRVQMSWGVVDAFIQRKKTSPLS